MPVLPAEDYKWNNLGELAKHFHKIHEKESYETLLKKFEKIFQKIKEIVDENSDKQLYSIGIYNWTGNKWPLGRWINVNSSSPYKSARTKIRACKRLKK